MSLPSAAYRLTACNLKLAKGYEYKSRLLLKRRGLLIIDGHPGARSALLFGLGMGSALLVGCMGWGLMTVPPAMTWGKALLFVAAYFVVAAPTASHIWKKPAEARKILLDCRHRRAEFRIDEGAVDRDFRRRTRTVELNYTTHLFSVEPVNAGTGMFAVVINVNGFPFAVAASRSAQKMIDYAELLNDAVHRSFAR